MFGTSVFRSGYRYIAKPYFFNRDPEDIHDWTCRVGEKLGKSALARWLVSLAFKHENLVLEQDVLGIHFNNPVGLAAGFDKNATLTRILPSVGFGFAEVGSITGEPCQGNQRPRLWRLPKSRGLVVYYGLKNDGCKAISERLRGSIFEFPVGVSVAKTNSTVTIGVQDGIADYVKAFRAFLDLGHYFTLNISCPNTFGGEPFTDPDRLDFLLAAIDEIHTSKPVLLKIPADLTGEQLDALVVVADRHRIQGFIVSNLTKKFDRPEIQRDEIKGIVHGGVSGKPTYDQSNTLIAHLYKRVSGRYIIIGCGGIFSAEDAYEKIRQGAALVQLITGMIFEGPQLIGEINRGLVELLHRDGFRNIGEAVGSAHRDSKVS